MFTTTQEFSALGQSQFDKAVRFSSIALAGAERLAALQLELSRAAGRQCPGHQGLERSQGPEGFAEVQSNLAQPSIDQAFSVARNVYDAALATQNELAAFVEEQIAEGNQTLLSNLDRLSRTHRLARMPRCRR